MVSTAVTRPVKLPTFVCQRCGHRWHPRLARVPLRCARCKSPYWRTPPKEGRDAT